MNGIMMALLIAASAVLSPSLLNEDPAAHDGQVVEVRGYLHLTPGGHVLYEARSDLVLFSDLTRVKDLDRALRRCLTVHYAPALKERLMRRNEGDVVLKGRFYATYLTEGAVDLGACSGPTAIMVDDVRPAKTG
jgi:hypothetical protein